MLFTRLSRETIIVLQRNKPRKKVISGFSEKRIFIDMKNIVRFTYKTIVPSSIFFIHSLTDKSFSFFAMFLELVFLLQFSRP